MHGLVRAAATAAFALVWLSIASTGKALAAPVLIDAGNAPVVAVQLRSGRLAVRTWNRNQVQVNTQGSVNWFHATPLQVANALPTTQNVLAQTAQTSSGPVTLPPETFVLPALPPGSHQGVRIVGNGTTTITIPQGTALLLARVQFGGIAVRGYHQGTFVTIVHTGPVILNDVSGTGFVQTVKGQIRVNASSFDRIRARTGSGNILFEGCTAQQIEVTSIRGSIAYDNGSFTPGLARFESQYGNIALGVLGGAQVNAYGTNGRVYTDFSGRANVLVTGADARGAIDGGGPAVTASAANGTLLLYDGALRNHPALGTNAPQFDALLHAPTKFVHPGVAARAPTRTIRLRKRPPR